MRFLSYGRVVDTSRMKDVLGFTPRYSTREAFDDFVERPGPARAAVAATSSARSRAKVVDVLDTVASRTGSRA